MQIIHGTWIPDQGDDFIQKGGFYLWTEKAGEPKASPGKKNIHPLAFNKDELKSFVTDELGIKEDRLYRIEDYLKPIFFFLPSSNSAPLPSPEAMRYEGLDAPEEFSITCFEVTCFKFDNIIRSINDIHFLSLHDPEIQLGSDFLFWHSFSQAIKEIILKDQYIPALFYHEISQSAKGKRRKKKAPLFEIYPGWQIISEKYENLIIEYSPSLPFICTTGFHTINEEPEFYEKESLLRHFSECILFDIVIHTNFTAKLEKNLFNTFIYYCLHYDRSSRALTHGKDLDFYKKWLKWKEKLTFTFTDTDFVLSFRLIEAHPDYIDNWQIVFIATSKKDPSFQVSLRDYWLFDVKTKKDMHKYLGSEFERKLLLNLGTAARIYPEIWRGLESDSPTGFSLTMDEAFDFLKEKAWVLEESGYKVIVPAWWTPEGRKKARIRLKTKASIPSGSKTPQGYFSIDSLIKYRYELSIGGEPVTEKEWLELVNAKTPLVRFRGQWIELDRDKMKEMLEFWQKHFTENPEMSIQELMRLASEAEDDIEFDHDQALSEMMMRLHDKRRFELVEEPSGFHGHLRPYQKRGLSWLNYLEDHGLNPCLADDMGLGKTIQIIARLLNERNTQKKVLPTLLIAPTSVLGNWKREIEKFAPALRAMIHHGSNRIGKQDTFKIECLNHDVVITSFSLARKDTKLFSSLSWQRIVVDEAQNIKNPKSGQTRAIVKLEASHRIALTGTPIENRLLDLWSIFNFLNPGYLGKEAWFKRFYEKPIQKDNNPVKSKTLKQLVEPFILRRVKTDRNIIKDLPDKVEHKQYCNLTKEQASLYEAVVREVEKEIDTVEEGIERKGLILSTLLRLKQICNHPSQFLQDGSEFSSERSHKLKRISEMIEEVRDNGESALIFSQFKEICDALNEHVRKKLHFNTYYIHGGTTRAKREKMIAEFQDEDTESSVFVLSLKAGGVGITLTKANHVFHFDRWWNPAVEDQASDRAFRIGQTKNVFVHKLITMGTLEERIDRMIEDKKKLSSSIVGTEESWLTELDNEAFKKLIHLSKDAVMENL
jgi:SNF2 family DNA or RNA helicase